MLNESKKPTNQKSKCKKKKEHNAATVNVVDDYNVDDDDRYNMNILQSAVSRYAKRNCAVFHPK